MDLSVLSLSLYLNIEGTLDINIFNQVVVHELTSIPVKITWVGYIAGFFFSVGGVLFIFLL